MKKSVPKSWCGFKILRVILCTLDRTKAAIHVKINGIDYQIKDSGKNLILAVETGKVVYYMIYQVNFGLCEMYKHQNRECGHLM